MSLDPHGDPTIAAAVSERGVAEVLHFTTSHGLVGIFAKREVSARAHLSTDDYLEHIYRPNAATRYEEPRYWRYANLSISQVNGRFFWISQGWHAQIEGLFWAILHLDPSVLAHPGVLFSPGNMAYSGVTPTGGLAGFTALFDERVPSGFGKFTRRPTARATYLPTDPQAEVLYPDRIGTRFLHQVSVRDEEDAASVEAIVGAVNHPEVAVVVNAGLFR